MKMYAVKETKVGEFINATIESEHGSAMIVRNDYGVFEMGLLHFDSPYVFKNMLHTVDNAADVGEWLRELVDRQTYSCIDDRADEWGERAEALQFAASVMAYLRQPIE